MIRIRKLDEAGRGRTDISWGASSGREKPLSYLLITPQRELVKPVSGGKTWKRTLRDLHIEIEDYEYLEVYEVKTQQIIGKYEKGRGFVGYRDRIEVPIESFRNYESIKGLL